MEVIGGNGALRRVGDLMVYAYGNICLCLCLWCDSFVKNIKPEVWRGCKNSFLAR